MQLLRRARPTCVPADSPWMVATGPIVQAGSFDLEVWTLTYEGMMYNLMLVSELRRFEKWVFYGFRAGERARSLERAG